MQIQSIDSLTHEQAKEQLRLERAANLELRQQLEAIGAGGVSSERMMQPASVPSDAEALKQLLSILDGADAMGWDTTKARALLAKYGTAQSDAEDAARYRELLIEACNVILWAQRRLPAAYNIGLGSKGIVTSDFVTKVQAELGIPAIDAARGREEIK